METLKVQLTEEEKKRNRERIGTLLSNREEIKRKELLASQNDPGVQKIIAQLREKQRKRNGSL